MASVGASHRALVTAVAPPLTMEVLLLLVALTIALAVLTGRAKEMRGAAFGLALLCGLAALATALSRGVGTAPVPPAPLPAPRTEGGFVSSSTCRSCHPGEHASWHRSFHRTMTQPATPQSVRGDFDDVTLTDRGVTARLHRRGDAFFFTMPSANWFAAPPEQRPARPEPHEARVRMVTGSHHMQVYWVLSDESEGHVLQQAPWIWLISEQRWAPNQDSFLTPRRAHHSQLLPWITSCNMCHSVATEPHLADDGASAQTAELGIACEACHGPGEEHVRQNQLPWRRYRLHLSDRDTGDPTITNPARLDKQRSTQVCGQCHSFHKELDMGRWARTGVAYRAGGDLDASIAVFRYTENPTHPRLLEHLASEPQALVGRFWKDGTMRVAGREYNGLLESRCHTHGAMTCLSCHSMHRYDEPSDQLARDRRDDATCLQCHADYAGRIEAHTHHPSASAGARCMNCHMPHTSFGLMTAIRSHRIDSPSAKVSVATGRPNACNLCHLDRTLAWTANTLSQWYGQPAVAMSADQTDIAASVLWLTRGDAAQRAVTTWAAGWEPALEASGRRWQGAFLTELLRDPYVVTRQVAYRSLRALPGFSDFAFDFLAPPQTQHEQAQVALRRWIATARTGLDRSGKHLLLDAQGNFDVATHTRLLSQRDNTEMSIIE